MKKQKPYACFGHVFLANILDAGEIVETDKAVDCIDALFTAKGHLKVYDKATGDFVDDVYPGSFLAPYNDAQHRVEVIAPSVVFCFSGRLNHGYVPPLEPLVLDAGMGYSFSAQTKFFLCEGTLSINNKEMTGPCQIMMPMEKTATAKTDVYGIIIK